MELAVCGALDVRDVRSARARLRPVRVASRRRRGRPRGHVHPTGGRARGVPRVGVAEGCAVGLGGRLGAVTDNGRSIDTVIADLVAGPISPSEVAARVPASPGLYAWWAPPKVLSDLHGPAHPSEPELRLLYVGIAYRLRSRLGSNHMKRSGSSTLRRTLAGLLLDVEGSRTRWTDRVVLIDEDERRLTAWMTEHLRVSWCEQQAPRDIEGAIIRALLPPLNVDHASGPALHVVKAARRRYSASGVERPPLYGILPLSLAASAVGSVGDATTVSTDRPSRCRCGTSD